GPRARGARSSDHAACAGTGATEPATAGAGGGCAGAGAGPAVRVARGLSRAEGQRQLRAAAARPGRGRGATAVRATLLQRRGPRLQQRHPARARPRGRAPGRLRARGVLRVRRRAARAGAGAAAVSVLRRLGCACLLLVACALPLHAAERIEAYDIEVAVNADGSLEVVEHISVRAEGGQVRRGIYRDFPTRYRDRYGNRVVVGFEVLDVLRNGQPEPWFTERRGN